MRQMSRTVLTVAAITAVVALAGCSAVPPSTPTVKATATATALPTVKPSTPAIVAATLPCTGVFAWATTGVPSATSPDIRPMVVTVLNAVTDVTPIRPDQAVWGAKVDLTIPQTATITAIISDVLRGYGVAHPTTTAADLMDAMPHLSAADATAVRAACSNAVTAAAAKQAAEPKLDCLNGIAILVVAGSTGSAAEGLALVGQTLAPALQSALPIKIFTDGWAPAPAMHGKDVIPPLSADLVVVVGDVPGKVLDALPPKAFRVSTSPNPTKDTKSSNAAIVSIVRDVLQAGYRIKHPTTQLEDLNGTYHHDGHVWPTQLSIADNQAIRTGCGLDG